MKNILILGASGFIGKNIIENLLSDNFNIILSGAAEKLISALKVAITPVSQVLFPYFSRKAILSKQKTLEILRKLALFAGGGMFIISLTIFFFSDLIISVFYGNEYNDSIIVFRLLAIIPALVAIDTVFGTLTMLVFKRNKAYSRIIISAGVINIILALILIPFFQHVGAAISVLIVELFITINLVIYVQKNDIKIFNR